MKTTIKITIQTITILILIFFTAQKILADTHYVNVNNPAPATPYKKWATAATNIQDAVDVASSGGTVIVTNGIYNTGGAVTPGYSCYNRVVITNDITVKSVNGPENTIISGRGPLGSNAVRGVYMSAGTLEGLTVSNGHTMTSGDNDYDLRGGGVNLFGGNGVITNCIIIGNSCNRAGGGTYYGTVNNCTVSGNSAPYGGGSCYSTVNDSLINGNLASQSGGGAYFGTINNCTVSGNSADKTAGGTYAGIVNNCTINGNSAGTYGGGTRYGAVKNCTISGNSADVRGGGTRDGTFYNSIIYYNFAPDNSNRYDGTYQYCCTTPDGTNGTANNISAEPILVSASHIATNSPCIGAGSSSYTSGVDIDGETWKIPPSIGCDEVYANAISGSLSVAIAANGIFSYPGVQLKFRADISGKIYQSIWNFSDGTTETNKPNVSHSWSSPGDFDVILTAFNATYPAGISDTVTVHIITNIHYVNINNPSPTSPFLTWPTAATNIQDAVDVANNSGTILVTNGTYLLSSQIDIAKSLTIQSVSGPENTIVNGNNTTRCFELYNHNTIISGFTITNGYISGNGDGGGVLCNAATPVITNCTIRGNSAGGDGGGAYRGTVNNCIISGNSAGDYGGGTRLSTINSSFISGNSAGKRGGGTYYGTVNNCAISGNSAGDYGGGTCYGTINNCTISENLAGDYGGGTYNCTVNNSIIWYNSAPEDLNIHDGTISYSCSYPLPPGEGNFDNNPILLSSSHISPSSPCIGAGSNSYATGTDIDGENWKDPPSVGCDEVYLTNLTGGLYVDIYAKYTSAVVGAELEFKAIIFGKPASNYWSFGDGAASPDKYITDHSFSAAGEYEVILSAFNNDNPAGVSATIMVNIVGLDNATYYVNKANLTPVFPYNSWSTSASNIQDAVDAAPLHIKNAIVLVTNGIYDTGETVTPGYSSSNRVVITKDITVKSVNGNQYSVISGRGPIGSNAVRGVYMSAGILEGFTVSNGHTMTSGDFNYDRRGGGVNLFGGNGVVTNCIISGNSAGGDGAGGTCYGTVNNCTISGNSSKGDGGGTYYGTINNSTISGNSADYGGGTYDGAVNNCTISGNSAGDYGGGAYECIVNNCTISGNSVGDYGGGVSYGIVNNSTISGNSAGYNGGGTYECTVNNSMISGNLADNDGGGDYYSTINNCTIIGNTANNSGGGTSDSDVNNSIVYYNTALTDTNYDGGNYKYSCTTPLVTGPGNINNQPQFVDTNSANYHLLLSSPCIDAGTNGLVVGTVDLDGNPRIIGGTVDMGCYEYIPEPSGIWIIVILEFWIIVKRKSQASNV